MLYLKTFNENFNTEDYYQQIDEEKFNDLLGDDWKNERKFDTKVEKKLNDLGWETNRVPTTGDYRQKFKSLFIPFVIKKIKGISHLF